MNFVRPTVIAALAATVFVVGCATAPQLPVRMSSTAAKVQGQRVGVAMAPVPKVDTHLPGASCLLCYAAASVANSSLTAHAKTLPSDDLQGLRAQVADAVRKKGAEVVVIEGELKTESLPDRSGAGPNQARKDFSSIQKTYQLDKLIVIDFNTLGFERPYSAYIPNGAPRSVVRGAVYMVDLRTQALDWYKPINMLRGTQGGTWDEPPAFPGLTNAYYQVIEEAKDDVLADVVR